MPYPFIVAIAIVIIGIGFIFIRRLNGEAVGKKKYEFRMGRFKQLFWIVPLIVAIVFGAFWWPKYNKKILPAKETTAIFSWTLEPHQYGNKRTSGPQQAVIKRDDDKVFNFSVYYTHRGTNQVTIFEGEKISPKRIEGYWRQEYPKDGGKWYLETDSTNLRLYKGEHSDKNLEWTPIELMIKLN